MFAVKSKQTKTYNKSITAALIAAVMFVLFPACSGNKTKLAEAITERDSLPMMRSLGVTTFISDSGVIRYKIIAEEWSIFDKKEPPYWSFEQGVYLEKFDSLQQIDASIKADTAYYFNKKRLWELRSNVHIQNLGGTEFDTELLFWDEREEKIYSDKPIQIKEADGQILKGNNGFKANQSLTDYEVYNNSGILIVDKHKVETDSIDKQSIAADSITKDTLRN